MRICTTIVALLSFASVVSAQTTSIGTSGAESTSLPSGTVVILRNIAPLSSKSVTQGDEVRFRVVKPVIVDGVIVIAAGATATARVTGAVPAKRKGVGGRLELTFEKVDLVTGDKATIQAVNSQQAGGRREMIGNMVQAGILTAGLGAPLFLMQKGSEVEIRRGERFEAAIASDIKVSRADLLSHQPAPRTPRADAASLYFIKAPPPVGQIEVYGPWPFCIGDGYYHLAPNSTLKVEVPPGRYWIHTLYKSLRKVKPNDLISIDAELGHEYFFEYTFGDKKLIFKPLERDAAEKLMENSEVYAEIPLEEHPPRRVQEMMAQPKQFDSVDRAAR